MKLYEKRDFGAGGFRWILPDFWWLLLYRTPLGNCFWELETVAQKLVLKTCSRIFGKVYGKFTGHLGLGLFSINFHAVFFRGSGLIKSSIVNLFRKTKLDLCFALKFLTLQCAVGKSVVAKTQICELLLIKFWKSFFLPNNFYN